MIHEQTPLYKTLEWMDGWHFYYRLVNCIPNFFVLGKHKWGKGCLLYLHTHLYTITYLDNFTTSYKYEETNHINMLYLAVYLPQALYKLYSVAANHRQLYNHAFPGHQTDQQPEQDKKQNWPHTVHADTLWTVTVERTVRERKRCGTVHHYNRNISPQSPTTATSGTYSSGSRSNCVENQTEKIRSDGVVCACIRTSQVLVLTVHHFSIVSL